MVIKLTAKNIETNTIYQTISLNSLTENEVYPLFSNSKDGLFIKSLSKGELTYIIKAYKTILFKQYKELYEAKPFKASAQSYFINQMLSWNTFFDDLHLNEDEKLTIELAEGHPVELELCLLIQLFNNFDSQESEINLEIQIKKEDEDSSFNSLI